ncbi:MAG: PDR/VanB family oxidoreductase [Vicinamibacterales bacterium]|nr:PDR/VanB family oxidoreductase [Vicinamibacterales bacterium]
MMTLVVLDKRALTREVVQVRLAREDGGALPAFEAGAHLELRVGGLTRRYSLTSTPGERSHYDITVQRAAPSRGGSAFVHDTLGVGDAVDVDGPFNTFRFIGRPPYAVFIAGGIGLTPFYTMIPAAADAGVAHELHYVTRTSIGRLPIDTLRATRVFTYVSREGEADARRLDIVALLRQTRRDAHLYVCGPRRMIEEVRSVAERLGWPKASMHAESFGPSATSGDRPVTVHLEASAVTLQVAPGTSILQAMLDHGIWASYACRRGECGSCYVEVADGIVDHRDVCLSAAERRAGMCPCVSWPTSGAVTIHA